MATVPEYQRRVQTRAINQQAVSVDTNAQTFGAGIGQAVQGLGEAMFSAADAIDFKDQLTADADARNAFNGYRAAQRDYLLTPETGLLNQTGDNALGAERRTDSAFKNMREANAKGLSPRARKKYDQQVDDLQFQGQERVLNHSSTQTRNYIENQRKSTIEGYMEEAASNWDNQELFDHNVGLALKEQGELGKLQGWDEATTTNAAEALISGAFKARIIQTAAKDALAAEELLNNSRDILNADDEYALDNDLKGLVIDAKVNKFIKPFVNAGGGVSGGDPYERAVLGAESGGNRFAANNKANPGFAAPDGSASSALGPHQFLRGTYIEQVRNMQKEGGAQWAAGMSDAEIAATRTDAGIEQGVFNYFRAGNQARLKASNLPITPVSEYAMHHFGIGGGPALMTAVRDNPGASMAATFGVNTPGILKANPQFAGMTAGQAYDWLANHLGADSMTANGQPFFDSRAALTAAMSIDDPQLQEAALRKVSTMMALQDKASGDARQAAQETAWDNYLTTGNDDVPLDLKRQMGQGGWTAYQSAVANDQRGTQTTDMATWEELTRQASEDPKGFSEVRLIDRRSQLTESDYRQFVVMQEAAKAKMSGDALKESDKRNGMDFAKMFRETDDVYRGSVSKTPDAKRSEDEINQRLQFENNLMRMAQDFFDREKREPNTLEVRKLAATLTLPVTYFTPGTFTSGAGFDGRDERGSGKFFEVDSRPLGSQFEITKKYDDIPVSERTQIAREIMMSNGGELPTADEVADTYENRKLMEAGLPPMVNVEQLPQFLLDVERGDNPDITDDELIEKYQLWLMSL